MKFIISGPRIFRRGSAERGDVLVDGGRAFSIGPDHSADGVPVYEFDNCFLFPGFTDVHVHFREPGFSYKETIRSGSLAAAAGGFTAVCAMPNLAPVPDSAESLERQLDIIRRDARVRVLPYGALTVGEKGGRLSDMEALAPLVCGFSDDGVGVRDAGLMREAMHRARELGKPIAAHCEDTRFSPEDAKSEWSMAERDLELLRDTGCRYHVCHVSSRETLRLIRAAKADGLDVTCETAPHYLLLDRGDVLDDGRFKMNPPLRDRADREALVEATADGTVDIIATDHAPHSREEKSRGFAKSLNGIVGLETAFPALYTGLVKSGALTLERLIELLSYAPNRRFSIDTSIENGDFTLYDLDAKYTVEPESFQSMGRATPFAGRELYGRCLMTACGGEIVWAAPEIKVDII